MTIPKELQAALEYARQYTENGRKSKPFRGAFVHTQEQLTSIDSEIATSGHLSGLKPGDIDVGLMAA